MKPRFSMVELIVVIAVVAVLVALLLSPSNHGDHRGEIYCMMNVRQVTAANVQWAIDHDDKFPMEVSVTNGGAMEPAATGNAAACFQVLSHQLSSPSFLTCPNDTFHTAATNFQSDFANSHISYFAGLDASMWHPQGILCGDANLAIGGVPVNSGLLELSTNASVAWTKARHAYGGTLGFVDGHAVESRNSELQSSLQLTLLATNRFAIP